MRKAVYILCALLAVSLWLNYRQWRSAHGAEVATDTTTVTDISYHSTIDSAPRAVGERVVGYVGKPRKTMHDTAAVHKKSENLYTADTLPVVQRVFTDDSTYTAYVSGAVVDTIHPRLDSITIYNKVETRTVTIRETVAVTKPASRHRRWNVGLVGGYGYGFTSRQLEPFVGVGVTVNLFR